MTHPAYDMSYHALFRGEVALEFVVLRTIDEVNRRQPLPAAVANSDTTKAASLMNVWFLRCSQCVTGSGCSYGGTESLTNTILHDDM